MDWRSKTGDRKVDTQGRIVEHNKEMQSLEESESKSSLAFSQKDMGQNEEPRRRRAEYLAKQRIGGKTRLKCSGY